LLSCALIYSSALMDSLLLCICGLWCLVSYSAIFIAAIVRNKLIVKFVSFCSVLRHLGSIQFCRYVRSLSPNSITSTLRQSSRQSPPTFMFRVCDFHRNFSADSVANISRVLSRTVNQSPWYVKMVWGPETSPPPWHPHFMVLVSDFHHNFPAGKLRFSLERWVLTCCIRTQRRCTGGHLNVRSTCRNDSIWQSSTCSSNPTGRTLYYWWR